jgi:hypothetical protein
MMNFRLVLKSKLRFGLIIGSGGVGATHFLGVG